MRKREVLSYKYIDFIVIIGLLSISGNKIYKVIIISLRFFNRNKVYSLKIGASFRKIGEIFEV